MKVAEITRSLFLALIPVLLAAAPPAGAGEFEVPLEIDAEHLVLVNLIGEVVVEGHGGSEFEVEVRVRGDDADRDLIQVDLDRGRTAELVIEFPVERESHFVYPRMGRRSNTSFQVPRGWRRSGSLLDRFIGALGGNRVRVSGSGRGLEVWADVTVMVPSGAQLTVELGAGTIDVEEVEGSLSLDTRSGPISVTQMEGDLLADTGSGAVEVEDVKGDVSVDTGSGHVVLRRCEGRQVLVDTGSGHVRLIDVNCDDLNVDTGSGGVIAKGVGANDVMVDTGSGQVVLELERMGDGRFVIDTGSGSIDLLLPRRVSAQVEAETGSGRIRLDLAQDIRIRRRGDSEIAFRLGDGDADIHLDTGSGSITVSQ